LIDVFIIKEIEISDFQTVHESSKTAVSTATITSNIDNAMVDWQLNNSQDLLSSTENVAMNVSDSIIVVIESAFTDSGIYPLSMTINSSTYQDNATGVAIS